MREADAYGQEIEIATLQLGSFASQQDINTN